jgi:hypothetical protein
MYDTSKSADTYDAGNWTFQIRTNGASTLNCVGNLYVVVGKTDGAGTPAFTTFFSGDVASGTDVCNDGAATFSNLTIASGCNGGGSNCTFDATQKYLMINFYLHVTTNVGGNGASIAFHVEDTPDNCNSGSSCPNVATTLWLPEKLIFFIAAAPFIPLVVMWMRRRKRLVLATSD